MQRLLAALGEDGLDDVAQGQLAALGGGSDDEEDGEDGDEDSEDSDEKSVSGDDESASEVDADAMEQDASDDDEDEEEDDEVALDEISGDEMDMDIVPRQKVTVDDKAALDRIHSLIKLPADMAWTETLTVTYPESINVDVDNDLERELAFYKQALHGAQTARALAKQHNLPWTRPADYFAEMVKSDAHMERVRQRLLDESAGIQRAEAKRREREGKKFGKQVQQEKLRERAQARKEMDEKVKGLKRKRKGALDGDGDGKDEFDVALDDDGERSAKRRKGNLPRSKRDQKFGFGAGAGRRSKQNTRDSTDDFRGKTAFKAGGAGKKGGPKRLGKARRMSAKSKK
ncbi:eukaryotic rRNA processing [Auricularia subglabra TFB-10046 SS5]|nr:eukaryotic rRNA processing [Auricularia subglabra TFB-10046 SS5]